MPASADSERRPDLAEPEQRAPHPCDGVVDERRRLRAGDLVEDVAEAAVEQGHGDELVQPEALPVERGEPERRPEHGQRDDR